MSQLKDRPVCSVRCDCGCTWSHHQRHTCSRRSCGSSRAAAASDSVNRDVNAGVASYGRPSPSGRRKRHGFAGGRSIAAAWSSVARAPVAALDATFESSPDCSCAAVAAGVPVALVSVCRPANASALRCEPGSASFMPRATSAVGSSTRASAHRVSSCVGSTNAAWCLGVSRACTQRTR